MSHLLKYLCALFIFLAAPARAEEFDLQLVLAVDASSSINYTEFNLQMRGYAAAFRDPALYAAIKSGTRGRIVITMMQWANPDQQKIIIPWTIINDERDLSTFADKVEVSPRAFPSGGTAIGDALIKAAQLFNQAPGKAARQVIDVSGDGERSHGRDLAPVRLQLQKQGFIINGLAILNERPKLDFYYMEHMIAGAGAFVEPAADFKDFSRAILRKLVREIRGNWYGS